jgi:hypothetical protein
MDALKLAILFHETYERLAPSFGYETRDDTKKFDETSKNGRLMVAVCGEILSTLKAAQQSAPADLPVVRPPDCTCQPGYVCRPCRIRNSASR